MESTLQKPQNRHLRIIKTIKRLLCGLLILLVVWFGWNLISQLVFRMPGSLDFTLHRSEYERIVRDAKAMPMTLNPPDTRVETTLEGQTVTVERDSKGQFIVAIQTVDGGHAGDYGYVYSDAPLVPISDIDDPSNPSDMDLPIFIELNEINQKINAHWWSVRNSRN